MWKISSKKSLAAIFVSIVLSLGTVQYISVVQSNHVTTAVKLTESTLEIKQYASALYHKLTSLEHAIEGFRIIKSAEYKTDGLSILTDIDQLLRTIEERTKQATGDGTDEVRFIGGEQIINAEQSLRSQIVTVKSGAAVTFTQNPEEGRKVITDINAAKELTLRLKNELDTSITRDVILIGEHAHHVVISALISFGVTVSVVGFLAWLLTNQHTIHRNRDRQMQKILYCDHMTGVPNRRMIFDDAVNDVVFPPTTTYQATCMVDIDSFNTTNDTIGTQNGDDLIKQIVQRIEEHSDQIQSVSRFGGDEFIVVYDTQTTDYAEALKVAKTFACDFMKDLERPFDIINMPFENYTLSFGIGLTLSKNGSDNDEIPRRLKEADIALYSAKSTGRGEWCLFKPSMEIYINHQLEIERNVRKAVGSSEISIKYEPIVKNGKIIGAESIVSWADQETGIIYNHDDLTKITERLRLSTQVGHMNMEETCKQLREWLSHGIVSDDFIVSVNVSGQQIKDPNFAKSVKETADRYNIPYHCLRLEIADGVMFNDIKDTLLKLRTMKDLGVVITLDDFGSGFTSLTHLRTLPVTDIKISKTFTEDVHLSRQAYNLMYSLYGICEAANVGTIVDGVEFQDQLNVLLGIGFDSFQGKLFGAAVSPHRFVDRYLLLDDREEG